MRALQVESQKQKLLQKTLGDQAPEITQRRMIAISDILNFDLFWNNMLRLLAGLLTVSDFGAGLTDFDIFHANFRIRLPTLEELLQGVFIGIEPVSLEFDFSEYVKLDLGLYFDPSWSLDFPQTLKWFFKFEETPAIAFPEANPIIARFDVTKYGEGVYCEEVLTVTLGSNPPVGAGLLKGTVAQTYFLSVTPWVVEQYAVMLGNYQLGKAYAMRIDFLEKVLKDAFFLGFGMLGYTPIRSKEVKDGQEGVTVHLTVDGRDVGVFVNSLDKITYGFILGVTPLGLGRFTPSEMYTIFRNTAARYAWWRAMKQKELFVSPVSGLVFSVPLEQRESVPRSPRITVYGTHRYAQEELRKLVRTLLSDADIFTQNKYYLAALEVAYKNRIVHARSRMWKQAVSEDQFRDLWLRKWESMGLNRDILEALYERVISWRKPLEQERREKPLAL
jgi:hypothetical protein